MKRWFKHYSEFPKEEWRWPSFSPREMASKREGELAIDTDAMDKLQALRNYFGRPLLITSAYRSPAHNRAVGGATRSKHLEAIAYDVRMDNHDPNHFEKAARELGFTGFGFYPKSGFMHIDTGPPRSWGTRWPKSKTSAEISATRLPVETKPVEDRWLTGLIDLVLGLFNHDGKWPNQGGKK